MSIHVTNSIPTTLSDLLVKLKILSMTESGKKINMGNMTFTDSFSWLDVSTWFGALNRGLNGEGKKGLMIHLNRIIEQTIAAINEYQYTEFCAIIVNHLAQARIGIQNLTNTYAAYPKTVAKLLVLIENIDLQLKKNQKLLDGHKPIILKKDDSEEELHM